MKVLLLQDIKSLGNRGAIKEVKEGYGQNFLIAKGFAKHATKEVIAEWEANEKNRLEQEAKEIAELKNIEAKLAKEKIKVIKKLGANGSLYGAITKDDIAHRLQDRGFNFDKKVIELNKPIKATGNYEITLKLGHGIHAKLNVIVEGE